MRVALIVYLTGMLGLACSPKGTNQVVAVVGDVKIRLAELNQALPQQMTPEQETTERRKTLEAIIAKELFVQEAVRQGLDSAIAYQLEWEKKALVTRELFRTIAQQVKPISDLELARDYELLKTEDHCKIIMVPELTLAQRIAAQLDAGVPFETLAARHSVHPSRQVGGDMDYTPELYIAEPLRSAILALKEGQWTQPVFYDSNYTIVLLVDRRPADRLPPFAEMKQQLAEQLKLQRQREAATNYITDLRRRLEYNPEGLAVFYKPVDSITAAEKELWVAIRDGKQYVKVGRLLHVGKRFPPGLDTAIRSYAIRRAIEEDILYDDGLKRGLDKTPAVRQQLDQLRRNLLYEQLYEREIANQTTVTDSEVATYYQQHRDRYLSDFATVAPLIRNELQLQRRDDRYQEYLGQLRRRTRVTINEQLLGQACRKEKDQ